MQHTLQLRREELARVIAALPEGVYLVGGHAEEEDVVVSDLLVNFHVRAVERADGHRAVDHELHIARAGGLLARDGDLLGQVRRRDDDLCQRDLIVLHKHDLELAVRLRVGIDKVRHGDDQADDLLCQHITRRGFRCKHKRARRDVRIRIVLDLQIQAQDMQHVQKLALVLMQALDLHVKQAVGIDDHAVGVRDVVGKALLVRALDGVQLGEHFFIILEFEQLFELVRVLHEPVPDQLAQVSRERGVRLTQPAAVGDAVRHIREAVVVKIIVVAENACLQDLRMQARNAVYHMAAGKAEVRHAHLTVCDDRHVVPLAGVVRIYDGKVRQQPAVDLLRDGEDTRELLAEQLDAPALQRLGHDGVVRIRQRAAADVPRLVPAHVVLVDEQAHQLRHAQRRMGVVNMDGDLFRQAFKRAIAVKMRLDDALQRRRHQQILLPQAQALAADVIVGGIEHLGDRLRHGVLLQRAHIIAARERRHIKAVRLAGAPEDQAVDGAGIVAGDVHIVRHGGHGLIAHLRGAEFAGLVRPFVDLAAKADLHGVVLARVQPHAAHIQPVVGELHLPAVHDLLAENAELIADGIARHAVAKPRRSIHVARRQPPQTAVSKPRVGLHPAQPV